MKKRTLILIVLIIAICAISIYAFNTYKYYRLPNFSNGDFIENIILPDENNLTDSLFSLKGNIVLVQFWASWCGPCRFENAELIKFYSKYYKSDIKEGGTLKIFSVSVDKKIEQWKNAIVEDQMVWQNHVIDRTGEIADKFNVHSVPTTFLIDQQGMIIGVNLSIMQLESVLMKRLKKQN